MVSEPKGLSEPFFIYIIFTLHVASLIFVILAFCWVIPDHFPPWTAYHTELPAFMAAVLAMLASWRWGATHLKLPAAIWWALGLVCSAVIQWLGGLVFYGGDALVASIYLITFAAAWLCGYQWVTTDQKTNLVELTAGFLVTVALLTAFQVIAQFFQVEDAFGGWVLDTPLTGRSYGNVGQPNQAATVLLMGTVGAAILMQRARISPRVMWCTLLMLGAAITLTQSRTALLSAALMSVLFCVFSRPAKDNALTRTSVLLWLLLMYLAAWGFHNLELNGIKTGIGVDTMLTTGSRPLMWKQLIAGLAESPWRGFGWLQIATGQQAGALLVPGTEQTNYAHNAMLDLFLVLGIPGACAVLGLAGSWWWCRTRQIRSSTDATQAFFVLLPFLVHSLLEFPHAYAYFLFIGGLLLGGIDAWTEGSRPWSLAISKSVLFVFTIAWGALLVATGYEYAQAEEDFRVNRFENRRIGETPSNYFPPQLVLLTQLDDMLKAMRLRAKRGMAPEELEVLVRSSKRYSWAPLQFRTALSLALNDRPAEATQQLRVIKGLFNQDIYVEAKENFLRLQREQYPELARVELP